MINLIKFFSSLLIIISICLSDSGYNTIYLMEFDNLKNDFTNSHLKEALPDLIRENYKLFKKYASPDRNLVDALKTDGFL